LFAEAKAREIWNPSICFYTNNATLDWSMDKIYNNNGGGHSTNFAPNRHLKVQTFLFADGHVETIDVSSLSALSQIYINMTK
jgi:hypothetical protein